MWGFYYTGPKNHPLFFFFSYFFYFFFFFFFFLVIQFTVLRWCVLEWRGHCVATVGASVFVACGELMMGISKQLSDS